MQSKVFEIRTETKRTLFVELATKCDACGEVHFVRGREPLTYIYTHETGNLYLSHPDLWAKRELMARSASGQKAGARPAVANDPEYALSVAEGHLAQYEPNLRRRR